MRFTSLKFSLLFFVVTIVSCTTEPKPQETKITSSKIIKNKLTAPSFNANRAYGFISNQLDFGPRVPNSKAHRECAEYLKNYFKDLGLSTQIQKATIKAYNGTRLNIKNICAQFNPENKNRIALFAHWDSRHIADRDTKDTEKPILGANDGASGVGVIMEIMKAITESNVKPNVGIDIVLFDAEDYGEPSDGMGGMPDTWALGSQYWSRNISFGANYNPNYGILLDMVGAKDAVFPKEGHSMRHAINVVENIWSTAADYGYSQYFTEDREPYGITDDHKYVNEIAGIPTVDIIHYDVRKRDFGSFHHTHNDNLDIIHKPTLKAVGQTLLHVIYKEG